MTKLTQISLAVAGALLLGSPLAQAEEQQNQQASSFAESLENTKVKWTFRYRLEDVDQDNVLEDALASTLLTRVTLNTQNYNGFSLVFEADNVSAVTNRDDYNSLLNGNSTHSVIADPEATEINQAALSYSGNNTQVVAGRQRINLGNQRFVGGVAWRQNEQTFDGLLIKNNALENATITYAYVDNVNTILDSNIDTASHFLNYDWQLAVNMDLTFYGYLVDFKDAPLSSTQTIGARFAMKPTSGMPFIFNAEYAQQSDYADNPANLDADYTLAEVGYKLDSWTFMLGREVLSGEAGVSGQAFQTPLATKHKFQGWADQFLVTPDAGIEDTYFSVGTKFGDSKLSLVYHGFKADAVSQDYGSEVGVSYVNKLDSNFSFVAKLADYSSDGHSVDTRKIWLMLVAKF